MTTRPHDGQMMISYDLKDEHIKQNFSFPKWIDRRTSVPDVPQRNEMSLAKYWTNVDSHYFFNESGHQLIDEPFKSVRKNQISL